MFVYLFMQKPAIYLNELKLHCHFQSIDGICAKIADFKLNPFILFIDSFIHTSTKKIQKKNQNIYSSINRKKLSFNPLCDLDSVLTIT